MRSPVSRSAQNNVVLALAKQPVHWVSRLTGTNHRTSAQWLILVTAAIVNGLIWIYPVHRSTPASQTSSQTVLPPVSKDAKEHHTAEIDRYNHLLQSSHTQQDHLAMADALANTGCREAATEAYKVAMFHESQFHTHSPINSCKP